MKKKIFAVLSFLAMGMCFYFGGYLLYIENMTNSFQKTTAVVEKKAGKTGYSYQVEKHKYFSDKITILDYLFAQAEPFNFKEGDKINCYYSPANPARVVLKKGIFIEKYLVTSFVLGIVFLIIGVNYWRDPVIESCGLG
jgi:hypothetical protein